MNHKNVTVSLPEDILREARHLAVDKGLSLSRFLAELLEERVAYNEARESARERMRKGMNLGTHGKIPWTRDELYER